MKAFVLFFVLWTGAFSAQAKTSSVEVASSEATEHCQSRVNTVVNGMIAKGTLSPDLNLNYRQRIAIGKFMGTCVNLLGENKQSPTKETVTAEAAPVADLEGSIAQ